jgi:hypothetical protein
MRFGFLALLSVFGGMFGMTCSAADSAPVSCLADADCEKGACREGICVYFSTPLVEPYDPSDAAASDAADASGSP